MPFPLPEKTTTAEGDTRRVGVEIELSGLMPEDISRCVMNAFGGHTEEISPYELKVKDTDFGDFIVELDFQYLKELAREQQKEDDTSDLEQLATDLLGELASNVVPRELVCPPIAVTQLEQLEKLATALRSEGAQGTYDALHFAFGVHFNPELPALDAATVVSYFKAYLCLHDWLSERGDTDPVRRVTPYIRAFNSDYCQLVVATDYWPDLERFSDDYLAHNPTRNRALDLLPLLAWFDEERVQATVQDERVNKRPTLHYRLPNSDIGNAEWNLLDAWRHWLQVESLANDRERLMDVCEHYRKHLDSMTAELIKPWKNQVSQWLSPL